MDAYNSSSSVVAANNTGSLQQLETGRSLVFFISLLVRIFGVLCNGFVIYIFLRSKQLRNPLMDASMKTVFHLALTDLLAMTLSVVRAILIILDVAIPFYACFLTASIPIFMYFVAQFVLLITTLERFVSICHQTKYSKLFTKRSLNILFALAWLLPILLNIFPLFDSSNLTETQICLPQNIYPKWLYLARSIFFFIVMTLTLSFFIPIVIKAREFHKRSVPAHFYGVNAKTTQAKAKRRAIKHGLFMAILTIVFIICNFPFSIVRLLIGIGNSVSNSVFNISFVLGILNSVVNPYIYSWQKQLIRKEAIKYIPCKCFKKNGEVLTSSREQEFRPSRQTKIS